MSLFSTIKSKFTKKKPPVVSGGMTGKGGSYHSGGVMYSSKGKAIGSSALTKPSSTLKSINTNSQSIKSGISNLTKNYNPNIKTSGGGISKVNSGNLQNEITYNNDNTFSRGGKKVGSYETTPIARVAGGATSTNSAGGNSFGGSATQNPTVGFSVPNTPTVADYSSKDNETLKALQEESDKLKGTDRELMDRKIARQFKDQLDFIKQAKALAIKETQRANMEKANTQRAIQAAAGNLGTEFGAGVQQKVEQSNQEDLTKAQLPYVEQELALKNEQQNKLKDFVITSAFREGITDPMKVADYAAKNGVQLTLDDLQQFSKFSGGGESGMLSFTDAMKAGVPYGTTYNELYGKTFDGGNGSAKQYNFTANMYATRMNQAENVMSSIENEIASLGGVDLMAKRLAARTKAGNLLIRNPKLQQQFQAERNFINAVLRKESGAAISPSEYESAAIQYFPMPGDTSQVLAQKKANRQAAINAMIQEAGSVYGGQSQTFNTASSGNYDIGIADDVLDSLLSN